MTALVPRTRLPRPTTEIARPASARVTITDDAAVDGGPFRAGRGQRELTVVLWPYRAALGGAVLLMAVWIGVVAKSYREDLVGTLLGALLAVVMAWLAWKAWRKRVRITSSDERLTVEADGRPLSLPMSAVTSFEVQYDRATRGPRYHLLAIDPDGETSLLSLEDVDTLQWLQQLLEQRGQRRR